MMERVARARKMTAVMRRQTVDQRMAVQRSRVARRAHDLARELNRQMRELIRLGIECDIQAGEDGHSVSLWTEVE